jgi:hypothetical protein
MNKKEENLRDKDIRMNLDTDHSEQGGLHQRKYAGLGPNLNRQHSQQRLKRETRVGQTALLEMPPHGVDAAPVARLTVSAAE